MHFGVGVIPARPYQPGDCGRPLQVALRHQTKRLRDRFEVRFSPSPRNAGALRQCASVQWDIPPQQRPRRPGVTSL